MGGLEVKPCLSGSLSVDCALSGILSCEDSLIGELSCNEGLFGSLSIPSAGGYDIYQGNYNVIPKAFESQILDTSNRLLMDDVTVTEIPYFETSNMSDGMTVYIAKEVK